MTTYDIIPPYEPHETVDDYHAVVTITFGELLLHQARQQTMGRGALQPGSRHRLSEANTLFLVCGDQAQQMQCPAQTLRPGGFPWFVHSMG